MVEKEDSNETKANNPVGSPELNPELNKAVEDVKEGDVSSIASKKVVYGAARESLVTKQERDFKDNAWAKEVHIEPSDSIQQEEETLSNAWIKEVGAEPKGRIEQEEETLANNWEKAVGPESNMTEELQQPTGFEKVKAEWTEARTRAHELEEKYNQAYHDYMLSESKGLRGLKNLPRKMLGIQPKLTPELELLQEDSLVARQQYKDAGENLKDSWQEKKENTTAEHNEEVVRRYQGMLAHHLTAGVHKKRLETHKAAVFEAWGASAFRPAVEALQKHKYTRIGAMAVGYAALAGASGGVGVALVGGGAYLGRVAAAMGAGVGVGMGGQTFYVEPLRQKLKTAVEKSGDDFFEKDLMTLDQEIGSMTFAVQAREARTRTASMVAGIGVGAISAGLTNTPELETVPETATEPTPSVRVIPESKGPVSPIPESEGTGPRVVAPESQIPPEPSEIEPAEPITPTPENIPKPSPRPETPETLDEVIEHPEEEYIQSQPEPEKPPVEVVPQESIQTPEGADDDTEYYDDFALENNGAANEGVEQEVGNNPEVVADAFYNVQKGDNLWNIMEGKGPDAHPVGGQSEVLKDMSLPERRSALDTLFDYMDGNHEFAKEVGVLKSGGHANYVYPGEKINVSMLDSKLRELLGPEVNLPETGPVPEMRPEIVDLPQEGPVPEPRPDTIPPDPVKITQPESLPVDLNQLKVGDVVGLHERVLAGDLNAIQEVGKLGLDQGSLQELVNSISNQGNENINPNLTIDEYFNSTPESTITAPETPPSPFAPDIDQKGEIDLLPDDSNSAREISLSAPAPENLSLENYVQSVEQPKVGFVNKLFFGGGPDISGTFEKIQKLSFGEIKEIAGGGNLEATANRLGVTTDGYETWMTELQNQVPRIPVINDNETIGQYFLRVNSPQVTA